MASTKSISVDPIAIPITEPRRPAPRPDVEPLAVDRGIARTDSESTMFRMAEDIAEIARTAKLHRRRTGVVSIAVGVFLGQLIFVLFIVLLASILGIHLR